MKFMKIKKGDNIIVITGKDKGKEGKVARAFPSENKVLVEGVNVSKRHQRSKRGQGKGEIVEFSRPIHVSNVMIKDSKTGKRTRIGFKLVPGKKLRIARKTGSEI